MSERNTQSKRWMLTINNPSFKEAEILYQLGHHEQLKYMCWSAENEDEEDHTPHYHVYISFTRMWRFNRIKELLPRARIEMARKPELACFRYCTKGNKQHTTEPFYMEFGHRNVRTGEIKEMNKIIEDARNEVIHKIREKKMRVEQLTDDQLLDSKLCGAIERTLKGMLGPYRDKLIVICFVSPTGWGKSFSIWDIFKDVCTVEFGANQEWYISAEKEVMLFDEFCGQIRCQKMLKYLDKYPIALPIKGGHRPCYWKAIFICSNTRPDEWYTKLDEKTGLRESTIPDDVRKALYRRIGYDGNMSNQNETHVYDPMLYTMQQARDEMYNIVLRVKSQIDGTMEHEELEDEQCASVEVEDPEGDVASYMLDDVIPGSGSFCGSPCNTSENIQGDPSPKPQN